MFERWRRGAGVLDVDLGDYVSLTHDGRLQREAQITVDAETVERIRTGYMCAKCFEPFQFAWPRRCGVCGAPIRTKQAEHFAREYLPVDPFAPKPIALLEGLHERAAEAARKGS